MRLDRVMLAMDVVDTLRHHRALVETELDDDRRQYELVTRVRAIYESQGIEVSESTIREGVRALREDRFVYTPPERTLAVRLAEIYVERGKWALRAGIIALIGLLVWAAFAVPAHFREQNLIDGFRQRAIQLEATARDLAIQATHLEQDLERSRGADSSVAAVRLLADAEDALLEGLGQADSVASALEGIPDSETYVEDRARWDVAMSSYSEMASEAGVAFGSARRLLGAVEQLRSLQVRLDATEGRLVGVELSSGEQTSLTARVRSVEAAIAAGEVRAGEAELLALNGQIDAALAARQREAETREQFSSLQTAQSGVEIEPAAARDRQAFLTSIKQAMAAGDWERAGQEVRNLRGLVQVLRLSYELRIVSRRGDRSGVWRYRKGNRRQRNYYIIVEAIAADGQTLSLSIESEEDQSIRKVRRFGIRVAESVYEQVKADKLDNGLIDDVVFGNKRRGAREPTYRFPVAGGRITRW